MKTSRFNDTQILGILKQAEGGLPLPGLCRQHGMSDASFYKWRGKYGGIMTSKIVHDSIVYSDSWRGYNVLDASDFKHYRINHSEIFVDAKNHFNGIENFWTQAKRHLRKFNGVPKAQFGLFLMECEWRFNNSDTTSQLTMLK